MVLLVSVEGVRPDRVGEGMPRLARMFAEGVRFEQARTPIPAARPALATLLTGLSPARHQVLFEEHGLLEEHVTLAERLREQGWSTAAFVAREALVGAGGLGQGFLLREGFDDEGPDALVERARAWLAEGSGRRFAWVHFDDPTAPYLPPGGDPRDGFTFFEVDARGRAVHPENERLHDHARALVTFGERTLDDAERTRALALKDAETAAFDARLGRLAEAAGEDALVVVAGTFGESLGEHGIWFAHGEDVFDASIRVPLVFGGADLPSRTVATPVGLADVTPTLLDALGITGGDDVTGRSVAAAWRGEGLAPRPFFAQSGPPVAWRFHPRFPHLARAPLAPRGFVRAIQDPAHRLRAVTMPSGRKFVLDPVSGMLSAFDVREDPGEAVDHAADEGWAEDVARAREWLEVIVELVRGERELEVERGLLGVLREAGYL